MEKGQPEIINEHIISRKHINFVGEKIRKKPSIKKKSIKRQLTSIHRNVWLEN